MQIEKNVHAKNLVNWAKSRPEVLVLSGDLTSSTEVHLFKEAYPERFLSMGIAEQNMMSFAGGLAREGFCPFAHTFAVFIYRRAYDQISMSVAYPNLKVRMVGLLPGVTTPGGATHQAIEDISIMRALPNMTIFECGDATDVESVLDVADQVDGPVYIRMIRGEIPRLFVKSDPMRYGKARIVNEGNDITVLTTSICTEEAMRVVKLLKKSGLAIQHMHISTLKPFNDDSVLEAIANSKYGVITMENHTVVGGLGTIIAEKMAEAGLAKKLFRIGFQDTFIHGASRRYLMKEYGIDAMSLIHTIENIVGQRFGINEEELPEVHVEPVNSLSKAEGL